MSFELKTASISLRKAAALRGIRNGTWNPFFDNVESPNNIVAIITDDDGNDTKFASGDLSYADHFTWDEIRERMPKHAAAAELGKLGGTARTDAKAAAARINGKRGGRPRKTA